MPALREHLLAALGPSSALNERKGSGSPPHGNDFVAGERGAVDERPQDRGSDVQARANAEQRLLSRVLKPVGGFSTPDEERRALGAAAEALKVDFVCGSDAAPLPPASEDFVGRVPIAFARRHLMLGLSCFPSAQPAPETSGPPTMVGPAAMPVLVGDIDAWQELSVLSRFLGRPVCPILSDSRTVLVAINEAYQQRSGQAQAAIEKIDPENREEVLKQIDGLSDRNGREDLLDVATRAPVIRLVNLLLLEAVKAGASDVHVQPYEEKVVVRMRIDGVLYNSFDLPRHLHDEAVSRIKVMGRMNIAEKRLAQDGRATAQVGDRAVDLRLASLPTSHGERVVIRLLDKGARLYRLGDLGMPPPAFARFSKLINLEHGLVLVTGPTGSGKTTTLYAALQEVDAKRHNVLTIEDPIEYQLDGISQTQVSDRKGMTFASALRNVLRQDPDIIMVGEIRDRETATMAIQSALTGHLVFSTLHTNDAATAVTRLLDLGIEPYLVASSLVGVLAQRLVRRVCTACQATRPASADERQWLGVNDPDHPVELRFGRGCGACRGTGYRGRVGIFELLVVDAAVRRGIQEQATAAQLKRAASLGGMESLRENGARKILAGLTTIEEVERVTMRASGEDEEASEVTEVTLDERAIAGDAATGATET